MSDAWTHWSYKPGVLRDVLEQGDVLRPTDELLALLNQYHPYYATHPDNRFYLVLTQSCDLVRRQGRCKARYIAIAPVRTLKKVIQREFESRLVQFDQIRAFATTRVRADVERFLGHLFNNNDSSHFYLEAESAAGITEAMCGLLTLPISLKVEHYKTFLDAKVIGIDDAFQAKLGWLQGQLYSRVGTRDFEEKKLNSKIKGIIDTLALWLEEPGVEALKKFIAEQRAADPAATMDARAIQKFVQELPKKKALVIEHILKIATDLELVANPSRQRYELRKALTNDSTFGEFFK